MATALDAATTDVREADPSRAVRPTDSGVVDVDGVEIAWDVFGAGEHTMLFMPPWAIVHSRFWKAQIATMARSYRVVTYDGRGNG